MTNSDGTQIIVPSKTSTPSYVHIENPGTKISHTEFTGHNYDEWARDFQLALLAKGKVGYIDGSISKPAATSDDFTSWQSLNALVTAWIFNTIEPTVKKSISRRPEAKQVWLDIRNRFSQNNDARIYRLQADLIACRQGPTESLMAYYGRLISLWDDIQEADPIPSCPCNPCTCTWVSILDTRRERKKVRDFLMGLDDKFDSVRSQLLGINPLPTLTVTYNRLLQEESIRSFTVAKPENRPETMAFAARIHNGSRNSGGGRDSRPDQTMSAPHNQRYDTRNSRPNNDDNPRPYCIACKRNGHLWRVCFRVTGNFPEWWGDRPRDRIYINEKDLSRTVIPDVQGRAKYEQIKNNTGGNGQPPRAHMVLGRSTDHASSSSSQLDKVDVNSLNPTELDELTQLWQAHKANSSQERLNGPFLEDGDWCG